MVVVPMKDSAGAVIGVLQLINARRAGKVVRFEKQSETLLLSLASQAAVALKNARLTQELKDAYLDTIFRLSVAAEYKDKDTSVHLKRMSRYVGVIAEALGMPSGEVEVLTYAAVLHDIGKLGVPDAILTKPGKLEPPEIAEMREHTTFGAKILGNAMEAVLQLSVIVALTHHEKWDGTGYPRGLKATDIPLPGRIVAVADVFDALTSQRSYKPAFSIAEAVEIIKGDSGKHFDPEVVDAFIRSLDRITAIHAEYRNKE
jgi:HD-GYP domain-containing protein (c-di-GMP phosphodiesterase class II)